MSITRWEKRGNLRRTLWIPPPQPNNLVLPAGSPQDHHVESSSRKTISDNVWVLSTLHPRKLS